MTWSHLTVGRVIRRLIKKSILIPTTGQEYKTITTQAISLSKLIKVIRASSLD